MNVRKEITVTYEEVLRDLGGEFVTDMQPNQPVRISTVILPFFSRIKLFSYVAH